MKSVESVMSGLDIDEPTATELIANATEYSNRGKGLVLVDGKTADKVANLFKERQVWLSAELNDKVGWQFSQAVYYLRRRGWNIKTICLGNRMFGYRLAATPPIGE